MTQILGLTGGIASGKSTIAKMIKECNIPVIDADEVSREVVKVGEEAYNSVVKTFGKEILHTDGTINREKLGSIIFNNEQERDKLNKIVHPAVRERMDQKKEMYKKNGEVAIFLDIPLLFESNRKQTVDKVLLVFVDPPIQLERLMKRNGLTEEEARARISSQMPIQEKVKLADEVVNNNGTMEESKRQLLTILKKWNII